MQIQEKIVRVQKKRLITIPKSLGEDVGLVENSFARIIKVKGRLILKPVMTLPYKVRSYSKREVEEFLEFDKKESKELKDESLL